MNSGPTMTSLAELSSDELKIRELAEEYLKIQENTEFLTNVLRFQSHKKRIQMKVDQVVPDFKSIALLTVQLSYLLFTCHVKQTNIYISVNLYYLNPNKRDNNPEACCEYILQKDLVKLSEDYQKYLRNNFTRHEFSANQFRSYGQYTLQYIHAMMRIVNNHLDKIKTPFEKAMVRQFKLMEQIVKNFIEPNMMNIQHPRVVILALEESELFRENSILVKVMNNSIFTAIRYSKVKNLFQEISKMEYNLSQTKISKNQVEAHAREMENSIQNLFRFLIKCYIVTVEQSINDVTKMEPNPKNQPQNVNPNNTNTKPYVLGEVEGTNADRRYSCRIQVGQKPIRQFNAKTFESVVSEATNNYRNDGEQPETKPAEVKNVSKNQFLIEYMPAKGIISVKYITAIELNIENTDLIMFQCNSIAFHWSNVSMELVQKSPNKPAKRKERYLAFKTLSHLHISQRPLFKLLIMLDLVMLCAKIAEPELRKTFVKSQDYNKIEEITQKVDHMIKLFIKKIERFYKIVSQAEFTKNSNQ